MKFGKVGAEMSYIQSQMHSDCDSAESIADSDLEDGELRKKAWLHNCTCKVERTVDKSSRIPTASVKLAAVIQERGASAKRISHTFLKIVFVFSLLLRPLAFSVVLAFEGTC